LSTGAVVLLLTGMASIGLADVSPASFGASYPPIPRSAVERLPSCLDPMTTTRLPEAEVASAMISIKAMAGKQLLELGPCTQGLVTVGLTSGSERLAERIRAAYGPAVLITIGLTSWEGHVGRSPRCGSLPTSSKPPPGLSLSVRLASNTVQSGENLEGTVVVDYHAGGSSADVAPFELDTGQPMQAVVVRRGTDRVVAVYGGGIAGTGYELHLHPGESSRIPVLVGTTRCDGGLGSALPPGHYQVIALVMDETGKPPRYTTPAVGLTVTNS
jgi:hypothetical protein